MSTIEGIKTQVGVLLQSLNYAYGTSFDNLTDAVNYAIQNGSVLNPLLEGQLTNRVLLWHDEFETLDTNVWGYELGYIRNGEKQYYTSDSKNCFCTDSILHIKALKDNPSNGFEWSSASIDTSYNFLNGHGFSYGNGLIETKIKIPLTSEGVWPAWWSVGVIKGAECTSGSYIRHGLSWPNAIEIDMLDYIGKDAVKNNINAGIIYSDDDYSVSAKTKDAVGKYNLSDGKWHILGMEYTPTSLIFYQDRVKIGEIDISDVENLAGNHPFPLKYNLAMGATSGEIPVGLESAEFLVDWVRYYAPANITTEDVVPCTADIDEYPTAVNAGKNIPIYPRYSGVCENLFLSWKSSDTSVATVYSGYVHTIKNGSFTLSAKDNEGNPVFTKNITVSDNAVVPVERLAVKTNVSSIPFGETVEVSVNVYPTYATKKTCVLSCSDPNCVCEGNKITNNNNTGTSKMAVLTITSADGNYSETRNIILETSKSWNVSDTNYLTSNYNLGTLSFTDGSFSWEDSLKNGSTITYSGSKSYPYGTNAGVYTPNTTMNPNIGNKKISNSHEGELSFFVVIKKADESTVFKGTISTMFSGQGVGFTSNTTMGANNDVYSVAVPDMNDAYIIICMKGKYDPNKEDLSWRLGVKVNDDNVIWTDASVGDYYITGGSKEELKYGAWYGIGNCNNAIAKEVYYKQLLAYSKIKTDAECESIMNELYNMHTA